MVLQHEGLHRDIVLRCQHYEAACHVVSNSDLLLVLPQHYALQARAQLPLLTTQLPLGVPALQVVLYWHRDSERDPGHIWLRRLIQRCAPAQT
jgi:DNA-binding transcriptional LysR family regulator